MKTLLGVYGINALAFILNASAIFFYSWFAGAAGYGAYSIYIVFLAVFFIWELSLIKTAITVFEHSAPEAGAQSARMRANGVITWSLIPFGAAAIGLYTIGDRIFPVDANTGIGGSLIILIVATEHFLSYPANSLAFHFTANKQFRNVYLIRLLATALRHLFAWSVLLATGSIFMAISAIALKGAVFGMVCWLWGRRIIARDDRRALPPGFAPYLTLASFAAAALVILMMQEAPSVYLDRVYGREMLGRYRILYDLVAAIWFIAAVYPTILFTYLLTSRAPDPAMATRKIVPLSDRLALFHVAYFFGLCALISADTVFLGRISGIAPFALGVVAGVTILGYCRFLIEACQALGRGQWVVAATVATAIVISVTLVSTSGERTGREVGLAWLVSQIFLFATLKLALLNVTESHWTTFRDLGILMLPCGIIVLIEPLVSPMTVLMLSITGGLIASGALVMLMLRPLTDYSA